MSSKVSIEFKGTKDGIILQMDSELEFSEVLTKLEEKISKSGGFFRGAKIIGLDGRTVSANEKLQLTAILTEKAEMSVVSWTLIPKTATRAAAKNALNSEANSDKTEESSQSKKIPSDETDKMQEKAHENVQDNVREKTQDAVQEIDLVFNGLKEGQTQFVRGTMRSGRSVIFKGNVVVLGDVNPGAEIIADGNIVVMGHLRGVAHAGANGNHAAFVCANQLNPTQLRIGKLITRSPDEAHGADPEIAIVKGDMIVIEPYLI